MFTTFARVYLIVILPALLVLIAVRLVMTPQFLQFEYQRPGFPADSFGLTTAERLTYSPFAVDYLLNGAGIDYLGDLTFADGTPLYNERELRHMADVKTLTTAAFGAGVVAGALAIVCGVWLASRGRLALALRNGARLTLLLIIVIIVLAVVGWNFFFTTFHQLFFAADTWYFAYSDTLIRQFPEQFWFDAAVLIGAITALSALAILAFTRSRAVPAVNALTPSPASGG